MRGREDISGLRIGGDLRRANLKLSGDRADRMRHVPGEPHRLCFALSLRRGPELVDYLPPNRHLAHEDGTGPALDFSRVSSSTAVPSSSAS